MTFMPRRLVPKADCSTTCSAHGAPTSAADRRSPCEAGGAEAGGINEGAPLSAVTTYVEVSINGGTPKWFGDQGNTY